MQVGLRTYDILVDTRHQRVKKPLILIDQEHFGPQLENQNFVRQGVYDEM